MLLKDKYKPKNIEDLHYFNCYDILSSLIHKSYYVILLEGSSNIGKTIILNILKKTLDTKSLIFNVDDNITKDNILIIDDLDLLSSKIQFKIKMFLEDGGLLLATVTSLHKIIIDIIDRSMIIKLTVDDNFYYTHLKHIIAEENIVLNNTTIKNILYQSNNNIASAINFIQKLTIIKDDMLLIHYNILWNDYYKLLLDKKTCSADKIQPILNSIIEKNYNFLDVINGLLNYVKYSTCYSDDVRYKIIKLTLHYIPVYNNLQNNTILLYVFTNRLINLLN